MMGKAGWMAVAAVLLAAAPAQAGGSATGRVKVLHTYTGHDGLLVALDTMANPDGCQAGWLILPDTNKHAAFIQSALLSAQARRSRVSLHLSGCFQNYPQIVNFVAFDD